MDPILAGAAANLSSEAAKGIFEEIKRHIRYVIIYKKNVEKFEERHKMLIAKRTSVQQEIDVAQRNVEKIKADVEFWCERVDKKMEEKEKKVKELEDKAKNKCFIGLCPNIKSRYQLSRKAEEDATAFDELIRQCQFNGSVGYRDVPEAMVGAYSKDFEAFGSRQKVFDDVMEALKDDTISMIGVYGTGGVGKTTLVNEVARQVEQLKLFDWVVMVALPQKPDIQKIQDEIAELLGLDLREKSTVVRARRLCERLMLEKQKGKKILIVLDNIWKKLDLEEVGIPNEDLLLNETNMQMNVDQDVPSSNVTTAAKHKWCKILLTSRDHDVLSAEMEVKTTFPVGILKEDEAWDLFKKKAGDGVESPELRHVAIKVAQKCAGLPVAIATVARALRNKPLFAWEDALNKLQTPSSTNFTGISAEVYSAIELSYNHLESDELKQTFLLCGLLGSDATFEYLLRYSMGLGLFHGVNTVENTRNRLLTMVSKLKASSLLNDSYLNEGVNMHDLVCDVALAIASRDNHVFALGPGDVLEDWPDAETMKMCHKISLRWARINKFPSGDELNYPQLSFFYMGSNESSVELPTNFFQKMENLKVLDLTAMHFSSLPSINLLTKLQTLCLDHCLSLGDISFVGEIGSLEILSLVNSNIEMLPEKIGQLVKLKILDLSGCSKLKIIPPGFFSGLSKLEVLYMGNSFVEWEAEEDANQGSNASLSEFKNLSCLTTLHVEIPSPKLIPKDLFFKNLQRYKICIGEAWDGFDKNEHSTALKLKLNAGIDSLADGVRILLKKAEALYLDDVKDVKFVLSSKLGDRGKFPHLKNLYIQNGLEIQYILDLDSDHAADKVEFLHLKTLTLQYLPKLISFCPRRKWGSSTLIPQVEQCPLLNEQIVFPCLEELQLISMNIAKIWHDQISDTSYFCTQKIKRLIIKDCGNLEHLFSSSMARSLVNLAELEVTGCKSLREIISTKDIKEESNVRISFRLLFTLRLIDLPHLIRFCSENHRIEFPYLILLEIDGCPKLMRFMNQSDSEETQCFPTQALLDEKVVCPDLRILRLNSMNIQRIWHDQVPEISACAGNLNRLYVKGCHNLRCLFPSSMLESLTQLERVRVSDCWNMEEVISTEEGNNRQLIFPKLDLLYLNELPKLARFGNGSYLEFPLLRWVRLENCPTLETFISDSTRASETHVCHEKEGNSSQINFPPFFNEKVAFPQLEELMIIHIGNCRKIWHEELAIDSFCNLNRLWIFECDRLLNVFPLHMRERLQNLKQLIIRDCHSLQEIFEPRVLNFQELDASTTTQMIVEETTVHFVFPKLTYVELSRLPNLMNFYSGRHTTELPSLEQISVYRCHKVEIFASGSLNFGEATNGQPMFCVNEDTFLNLEELYLLRNDIMTKVWHGQLKAEVFHKLRVLKLIGFTDESAVLPHCFIQSLPNLENLVVMDASFSQIFHLENFTTAESHAPALTSLTELKLRLPELTHIWKEEHDPGQAFCNLRALELQECDKLKTLVPSSVSFKNLMTLEVYRCQGFVNLIACSTAKSLVQLSTISITDCANIEEIIAGLGDETEGGAVFTRLKHLELTCLPNLGSFCSGDYSFEFPALEKVVVRGCPKMKLFSQGYLSTPMLRSVQYIHSEDEAYWDSDLNTTIQLLFSEKVGNCGLHDLILSEASNKLMELWVRNPQGVIDFKSLKLLEVNDCSTLKYLFTLSMALELVQLAVIKVKNCIAMEHIIADAETEDIFGDKTILPQIEFISLENCALLTSFCQISLVREFPSLLRIDVTSCPRMLAFLEESRIETVDDGGNEEVTNVFTTRFLNKVVYPNLKELRLSSMNIQSIWHDQLPQMSSCAQNLTSLHVKGCHNLRCLFSSSMVQSFMQLQNVNIIDCRNIEEVIFTEGLATEDNIRSYVLPNLQLLALVDLPELLRFCHGSYFEFPLLQKLKIDNCPKLETFMSDSTIAKTQIYQKEEGNNSEIDFHPLFNEKHVKNHLYSHRIDASFDIIKLTAQVAFPRLEELRIMRMENCRKLWHDQLVADSFCKLKVLVVYLCGSLVKLFPFNMRGRLLNLEEFLVTSCFLLEEIFEPRVLNASELHAQTNTQSIVEETCANFVFPKLTNLELFKLPRLKSFYSRIHTTEWPSLKKMWVYGCHKIEIFASDNVSFGELTSPKPLFLVNEATFPNLEELKLQYNENMRRIWHGQLRVEVYFCKLRVVELITFLDKSAVFPHSFIQSLPNLEKLVVSLAVFSEIFNLEGFGGDEIDNLALTSLKELSLSKLYHLTHLWKEEYNCRAFCKLESLEVLQCTKLRNLVPSSVSFENLTTLEVSKCHGLLSLIECSTAKSLVQLTRMSISDCDMIEEIIAVEGYEVKGGIVLTNLKYLQLRCLPCLAGFYLGNHSLDFPALEKVTVIGCPKMKIFSQGDLSTPLLQSLQFIQSEEEVCWEGNLNTTIQWLFTEKVGNCGIGNLILSESSNKLMEIWRRNPRGILDFKGLKSLEVYGCSALRSIFTLSMALDLAQLCEMKVKDCTKMEHIIVDEGVLDEEVTNKIAFPLLKSITLESCADLESFYQGSKLLECPSLEEVNVVNCPQMLAFTSREQTEETVNDAGNMIRLSKRVATPFLNNANLRSLTVEGCHNLRYLFSSSVMKLFTHLRRLVIQDCRNVEEVIFIEEGLEAEDAMSLIFPELRLLWLIDLPKLMNFCHGSFLEFPLLRQLGMKNCPTFKTFISDYIMTNGTHICQNSEGNSSDFEFYPIFNEKVAFPQLEQLRIFSMENCRKIWQEQPTSDSFCKLNLLWISSCERLLNVFPYNMSERLQNLEELRIKGCDSLEELFEPQVLNANKFHQVTATESIVEEASVNFVFHKLNFLDLHTLPKFKSFYSGIHTTEWPSLKKMWVSRCDKMKIFASESLSIRESTNEQPLFRVNEVTFPNLEELKLEQNEIMNEIWRGQLRPDKFFCKLKVLELICFTDKLAMFPHCFIQSLPELQKLVISKASVSQVFHLEGYDGEKNHALAITSLNELTLSELPELTHLWKEEYHHSIPAFCELRNLEVRDCGKLKTLVPSSVSFGNLSTLEVSRCHGLVNLISCSTAKSLVQLTRLSLTDCEMIEEIIACDCDEVKGGIVFGQLKFLQLSCLPSLASFCSGDYILEFPTLEKMIVKECPKMKMFCQGDLSTPQLSKVLFSDDGDEEKGRWEVDLKTTIKRLFEEMLATRRIFRPPKKGSAVQRPRTHTLTVVHEAMLEDIVHLAVVHEAMLEDIVHLAEIVGKRTINQIDESKIMKVFLDPKEKNNNEFNLATFAGVCKMLTGIDVAFEYPVTEA
ncbi:Ribosomal protein S7e [Corchorus capsularis]|uniref:Ribosomal protein S7e n=1 Tax=Corchorus capsularis TaxID=210143 RepID=A0A1R3GWJ4_COCAP|nr:Ribosomal protein S7e [Corchorus capsularis]